MFIVLIINTFLCLGGFLLAFGLQMGAGYTWERKRDSPMASTLTYITLAFFATPLISIAGSWISHIADNDGLAIAFVGLPWLHLAVIFALLFVLNSSK
jgi:hypothetical protein